ncbi:hypothetical protein FQR65_LT14920 [Abscondita terminalis]|nr:hypothetical protein FQR65_LT14920 [Abscondita terminalis]
MVIMATGTTMVTMATVRTMVIMATVTTMVIMATVTTMVTMSTVAPIVTISTVTTIVTMASVTTMVTNGNHSICDTHVLVVEELMEEVISAVVTALKVSSMFEVLAVPSAVTGILGTTSDRFYSGGGRSDTAEQRNS